MTTTEIQKRFPTLYVREEKANTTEVWRVRVGSVCGVNRPWMAKINGETLGEFGGARLQADPMVFATREAARQFVARTKTIVLVRDICSTGNYAVAV